MTNETLIEEFQKIEDEFNEAVISNDVNAISKCIAPDWVLVDPQGGIIPADRFLYVVEQGILSHTTMTKEIKRVKVYDNVAVVTGRGQNTGFFKGAPIKADEWITDVYKKEEGKWVCVLTHLSPAVQKSSSE
ncbi:MAG TPA: nuclear transport factor 2 family protein [Chitinophagaceae bacterium]